MVKKNVANEICNEITEIKKILASPDVKNELVRKFLEDWKIKLLNDLHSAFEERAPKKAKRITSNSNNSKDNLNRGGRHEPK